jgi:hypothetical protein
VFLYSQDGENQLTVWRNVGGNRNYNHLRAMCRILQAMGYRVDRQEQMNDAKVMATAIVAMMYYDEWG